MKKEQYQQLKQMDRIEYLLLRQRQGDYKLSIFEVVGTMLVIVFYLTVIAFLMYIAFKSTALFTAFVPFFKLVKLILIIVLIIDVIGLILHYRDKKKLEEEFLKKCH